MNNGATYEWGGQDPLPGRLVVDCSGLVIRCYQYACEDYGYTLPFADTTSKGLRQYSLDLGQQDLSPGDLFFMGEEGLINHVALFIQFDETDLVFIDATLKEEENINGVSVRRYRREDSRFISYGRMLVWYRTDPVSLLKVTSIRSLNRSTSSQPNWSTAIQRLAGET